MTMGSLVLMSSASTLNENVVFYCTLENLILYIDPVDGPVMLRRYR